MWKRITLWTVAFLITVAAAIYQRSTGPTYPLRFNANVLAQNVPFKLTRSASIGDGCKVQIPLIAGVETAQTVYRKYPGNFQWDTLKMTPTNDKFEVNLPVQPPAGKLEYFVVLHDTENSVAFNGADKVAVVRFKGDVPAGVLIPHVLFMFIAMMFSTGVALMAIFKIGNYRLYTFITFGLLLIGGLIFGPIVQYFAFGEPWTGWPLGGDLTDNKTLIAFLFWAVAVVANIKKPRRWIIILASFVLLAVYSIPHSAWGSELNHSSGQIKTGK